MSQTVQPMAAADAARQQLQQLKTDSSQQLAQLMLEQQHKLSQMVQQLQDQQPVAAPATLSSEEGSAAGSTLALAGVLQLQQGNIGNMDLLLQRIHTTMHSVLATPGPQRGGSDDDKTGPAV